MLPSNVQVVGREAKLLCDMTCSCMNSLMFCVTSVNFIKVNRHNMDDEVWLHRDREVQNFELVIPPD